MKYINRIIWGMPGFIHDAVLRATGYRLVAVLPFPHPPGDKLHIIGFRWAKEYPL